MLIVGCGYIGGRLAQCTLANNFGVRAIVRSASRAGQLRDLAIPVMQCDLDQQVLPAGSTQDQPVFYFAPPPSIGDQDTRLAGFLRGLTVSGTPSRLVYISTTGVYGDCGGTWVDEHTPVKPVVDRAKRRWHAETLLQAWRARTGAELVILRVAGIYGPDKLPLERLRKRLPMISAQDAPWTNRIHADDLVATCLVAMQRGVDGEVYNACDDAPGKMTDYFNQVADLAGLARPDIISLDEAETTLSAGLLSYLRESRRVSNAKLHDQLGINLRYPTLQDGLADCFKEG